MATMVGWFHTLDQVISIHEASPSPHKIHALSWTNIMTLPNNAKDAQVQLRDLFAQPATAATDTLTSGLSLLGLVHTRTENHL